LLASAKVLLLRLNVYVRRWARLLAYLLVPFPSFASSVKEKEKAFLIISHDSRVLETRGGKSKQPRGVASGLLRVVGRSHKTLYGTHNLHLKALLLRVVMKQRPFTPQSKANSNNVQLILDYSSFDMIK